jgi:hypothetical protein
MSSADRPPGRLRLLFSAAWPGLFEIADLPGSGIEVTLQHRSADWGVSRWRHAWLLARDCLSIVRAAGDHDATVLCTGGIETYVVPLLWPLGPGRRTPLLVLDPIALASRRFDRLWRLALRRVDLVLCIRSGDVTTYGRRFGVPAHRCRFITMPAPTVSVVDGPGEAGPDAEGERDGVSEGAEPYIYSAGISRRDWGLLFRACAVVPHRCIVSTPEHDVAHLDVPPNVDVRPALSPEEGRRLMRRAAVVAVTFEETDLACGPLIVLDALAMGIPVVANDTNACRDYIEDGTTGLLSGTHDVEGLAHNLASLMDDPRRRRTMGEQARRAAEGQLSLAVFQGRLASIVREACAARAGSQ